MDEVDKVFQEELVNNPNQQKPDAQENLQLFNKEEVKSSIKLTKEEYKKLSQSLIQTMRNLLAQQPNQKITSELLSLHLIDEQINEFTKLEEMQK